MNLFSDWSDFPVYLFMWYIAGFFSGYLISKVISEDKNLKK
jgi:hypothetical protein